MTEPARIELRYTVKQYFDLVEQGILDANDRVELLDGIIVAMAPQSPRHASAVSRLYEALRAVIGERAVIRSQMPLLVGRRSVPGPDIMVIPGTIDDYDNAHPETALLVVEVADSSLKQDRITKGSIYAAGGFPEYWLVNLRDDCIEVSRDLDTKRHRYRKTLIARCGETIGITAFPGAKLAVSDVLPRR